MRRFDGRTRFDRTDPLFEDGDFDFPDRADADADFVIDGFRADVLETVRDAADFVTRAFDGAFGDDFLARDDAADVFFDDAAVFFARVFAEVLDVFFTDDFDDFRVDALTGGFFARDDAADVFFVEDWDFTARVFDDFLATDLLPDVFLTRETGVFFGDLAAGFEGDFREPAAFEDVVPVVDAFFFFAETDCRTFFPASRGASFVLAISYLLN